MKKEELLLDFQKYAKQANFGLQRAKASSLGDYLLHRKVATWALLVLVKPRWWVERDLMKQGIWIAFPDGKDSERQWHVAPHDVMVAHGKPKHGHTLSWKRGLYHKPKLSDDWVALYQQYKIEALAGYGPELIKMLTMQNAKSWNP